LQYEITHKFSEGTPRVPLLVRWQCRGLKGGPEIVSATGDVQSYLDRHFPTSNWELVCTNERGSGIVYTFRSIPAPDSHTAKNPSKYQDHYHHVRVCKK